MKNILAVVLAALMLLSVSACKLDEPVVTDEPVVSQTEIVEEPEEESVLKGILMESEWVLFSLETLGMTIDYNTLEASGYSGSMEFKDDDTFSMSVDMDGIIAGNGTYVCDDEKMTVTIDDTETVVDLPYEDGVLTLEMVEEGVTIEFRFVPSDSELIDAAMAELEAPQYDGELANTTWTLHSVDSEGVTISAAMFDQFGFSGSISFAENTAAFDLMGNIVNGSYSVSGDEITFVAGGASNVVFTRDGGLISLAAENDVVFHFAYAGDSN